MTGFTHDAGGLNRRRTEHIGVSVDALRKVAEITLRQDDVSVSIALHPADIDHLVALLRGARDRISPPDVVVSE